MNQAQPTSQEQEPSAPVRVLMVCLGNICRSPTAQGVLEKMVHDAGLDGKVEVDSAGTSSWHVGDPPDPRAQAHARQRGYELGHQRARQLQPDDFERFDRVLVMDGQNERAAGALCLPSQRHKLRRLASYCRRQQVSEIPDPYAGGADGFEHVLDLLEDACASLLAEIQEPGQGRS